MAESNLSGVHISVPPRNPRTHLPSPERCASRTSGRHGVAADDRDDDSLNASFLTADGLQAIRRLASPESRGDSSAEELSASTAESRHHRHKRSQYPDTRPNRIPGQSNRVASAAESSQSDNASPDLAGLSLSDDEYYQRIQALKAKNLQNLRAAERLYRQFVPGTCLSMPRLNGEERGRGILQPATGESDASTDAGHGSSPGRHHEENSDREEMAVDYRLVGDTSDRPDLSRYAGSLSGSGDEDDVVGADEHGDPEEVENDRDQRTPEYSTDSDDDEAGLRLPAQQDLDSPTAISRQSMSNLRPGGSASDHSPDISDTDVLGHSSSESGDEETTSSLRHNDVIKSMWGDFSLDGVGASGHRKHARSTAWSPKMTIPEPFDMTRREERRKRNPASPTKCIVEARQRKLLQEQEELAALSVRFTAKEVPDFVKKPLYETRRLEEEERRLKSRQHYAEKLLAEQEPFSFIDREQRKKEELRQAAAQRRPRSKGQFQAKPHPTHLFSPNGNERQVEDELYRQIRKRIRSDELLASSHLPCSMATRQRSLRYTLGQLRHDTSKRRGEAAFLTREHRFTPSINPGVPDFGELHRQLQRQQPAEQPMSTAVQPFFLRTELMAERKHYKKTGSSASFSAAPRAYKPPPSSTYVESADSFHTRTTRSSQLRSKSAHAKLTEQNRKSLEQAERQQREEDRGREVRSRLSQSMTGSVSDSLTTSESAKAEQFRASQRERDRQYREELSEMEQRLASRPLLVERTATANARLAVEHKFSNTLKREGVTGSLESWANSSGALSSTAEDAAAAPTNPLSPSSSVESF